MLCLSRSTARRVPQEIPRDHPGIAALIKHGFDVEVLDDSIEYWGGSDDDWIFHEWTRKIYIQARITIEIDEGTLEPDGDFLDWVGDIVEPFGGDPIEAGFADPRVRWSCSVMGFSQVVSSHRRRPMAVRPHL
jgi:hypothetical protein